MSNPVNICPVYSNQFFDNNGNMLSGGLVYTYQAGSTSVLQTTYSEHTGTTANTNPLVLDSSGRLTTEIWLLDSDSYNIVVKLSDNSTVVQSSDNISNQGGVGVFLPLAGGTSMTGLFSLAGDATTALEPTSLEQVNAAIAGLSGTYLPLTGGTLSGALILNADATMPLQAVTLEQLTGGYLPLTGGTLTGTLVLHADATSGKQAVTYEQMIAAIGAIGGSALSAITAATAGNTIASGNNQQVWNWALTSSSANGMTFGETTAAPQIFNSLPSIVEINTKWESAATPLTITSNSLVSGSALNLVSFYWGDNIHATRTNIGSITYDGVSGVLYGSASDYRLKENIIPLRDAHKRLMALKPKRFNFKSAHTKTMVDGFLAHEAQIVVPEAVSGDKNQIDGAGNQIYQTMDATKLIPLITAALQEAFKEIDQLKKQIKHLLGEIK